MDATHFRQRALEARRLATQGEDPRLAAMLLDLAQDMEDEARLIEAQVVLAQRPRVAQPNTAADIRAEPAGLATAGAALD